ncbi:unnamed protein product [Lactuca saligna]|uniref:Uncharacterized protein n=1 Tax=Lactuca saligna TaxID=75948 RepID=A0AA35VLW7_LACSI|nr:unnamed protein product [Lactuca saligna]
MVVHGGSHHLTVVVVLGCVPSHPPGDPRRRQQPLWNDSHHLTVVTVISFCSQSSSSTPRRDLARNLDATTSWCVTTATSVEATTMVAIGDITKRKKNKDGGDWSRAMMVNETAGMWWNKRDAKGGVPPEIATMMLRGEFLPISHCHDV